MRAGRVSLLLFGSGMTALIYQIAWMRELRLIFGFWTAASAAVAIFMGGLGAGLLLGRGANLAPRPLAFYGWLELAIAGPLAVVPLFLWLVLVAYIRPRCRGRLKPMAMVTDPASIARYLAGVGEATQVPRRTPSRGPRYWKSQLLRRRVTGDEDGCGNHRVAGKTRRVRQGA
ncbi:MAG TPA: hypothetical protein VK416_03400 [Thermoanaerobaculia bacterium]|nr:hypothetical protein [Thermoanaerobaculia bacterium]